jgi:hypothetical protein
MATPNRPLSQNKYPEQYMQNTSFDEDFGVGTTEPLGYDGSALQRTIADSMAVKTTTSGSVTYIALASPGTAQATAKWQVRKVDTTSGVVITWCDGDANFDNVATDLTLLSYS